MCWRPRPPCCQEQHPSSVSIDSIRMGRITALLARPNTRISTTGSDLSMDELLHWCQIYSLLDDNVVDTANTAGHGDIQEFVKSWENWWYLVVTNYMLMRLFWWFSWCDDDPASDSCDEIQKYTIDRKSINVLPSSYSSYITVMSVLQKKGEKYRSITHCLMRVEMHKRHHFWGSSEPIVLK
jgi:hypothetical protein